MAIVVQKYGGSSVATVAALREVARQVVRRRRQGTDVVVVVSAMGKTTDALLGMAQEVAGPGVEPPRREVDMLVTAGERISMALLSMAIHAEGGDAVSFTGSQSGIITEDSHGGARILEVRPQRIREALQRGRIVIVAGYQGVSLAREVTTLGRGGSDTSAVALAAALGAEACEIYSDVDGVYSADPRVCPQARHLAELDYETMQTMAGAGAKVLNAEAVAFARRAGITLLARKTGDPSGTQTRIHGDPAASMGRDVVAVIGTQRVARVEGRTATSPQEILAALARRGATLLAAALGESVADGARPREVRLLVHTTDVADGDLEVLRPTVAPLGLSLRSTAAVTLVGAALGRRPDVVASLGPGPIYATDTRVTGEVDPAGCDERVRALHDRFIGPGGPAHSG